jgi:hypothetical protein
MAENQDKMGFLEHLEELRGRIIKSVFSSLFLFRKTDRICLQAHSRALLHVTHRSFRHKD